MGTVAIIVAQTALLLFGIGCGAMLLVSPARALELHNRYWQHPQQWWPDSIRKWYDPVVVRRSALMTFEYRIVGLMLLIITAWGLYSVLWNR